MGTPNIKQGLRGVLHQTRPLNREDCIGIKDYVFFHLVLDHLESAIDPSKHHANSLCQVRPGQMLILVREAAVAKLLQASNSFLVRMPGNCVVLPNPFRLFLNPSEDFFFPLQHCPKGYLVLEIVQLAPTMAAIWDSISLI